MIWPFACPSCREPLVARGPDAQACERCGATYPRQGGVWRMLAPGREHAFDAFLERYEVVRRGEGRRALRPVDLRALPFEDRTRSRSYARSYEWSIRARSFRAFLRTVIAPRERASAVPLRVLDVGSGPGWLAYQLARRGHEVAAVDILLDDRDGLGAHRHYDRPFVPVQAEFDRLPFPAGCVDLVVYNASFHYAADYATALREALRVLAPAAPLVVLDTPLYGDPASGEAMVREREAGFLMRYGLPPDVVRTEGFLTYARLRELAEGLSLRWEIVQPWYGLRWWARPWAARMRGGREPARFGVVIGRPA